MAAVRKKIAVIQKPMTAVRKETGLEAGRYGSSSWTDQKVVDQKAVGYLQIQKEALLAPLAVWDSFEVVCSLADASLVCSLETS